MISGLAAEQISEESLKDLDETIEQMRQAIADQHAFLEANKQFRDTIAWSSGNALFGYIVESLLNIMESSVLGAKYSAHSRTGILRAHEGIFEALKARDPEAAESRMRKHIGDYVKYNERKYPEVLKDTIPWDQRFRSDSAGSSSDRSQDGAGLAVDQLGDHHRPYPLGGEKPRLDQSNGSF